MGQCRKKEDKQTVQRSSNLLTPPRDHKELFVSGRGERGVMAGVYEAVRYVNNSRIPFHLFFFFS